MTGPIRQKYDLSADVVNILYIKYHLEHDCESCVHRDIPSSGSLNLVGLHPGALVEQQQL